MPSSSDTPSRDFREFTYLYDAKGRLVDVTEVIPDGARRTTYSYTGGPPAQSFGFEHDQQKRLFTLTLANGTVEHFRDNAARHLVVWPDPDTGAMRPVTQHGEPVYLYLCREEREV